MDVWSKRFLDVMRYLRAHGYRIPFCLRGHRLSPIGMPSPRQGLLPGRAANEN